MMRFANMVALPTFIPGLVLMLVYKNEFESALLITIASSFSFYDFYKNYNLIKSVEGYLKRIIISAIIFAACLLLIEISPEKDNAKAGAVFFVFLPCVFITTHMLSSSRPAKEFKKLYENS